MALSSPGNIDYYGFPTRNKITGCRPRKPELPIYNLMRSLRNGSPTSLEQLDVISHDQRLMRRVAKFIYEVLEIFHSVPIFVPVPYTYLPPPEQ